MTQHIPCSLQPVLKLANFLFANLGREVRRTRKTFGEFSFFSYWGEHLLRESGSGSLTNCDEAVFEVQNASLDILWELFRPVRLTWRLIGLNLKVLLWKKKRLGQQNMDDDRNVFSRFGGNGVIGGLVGWGGEGGQRY